MKYIDQDKLSCPPGFISLSSFRLVSSPDPTYERGSGDIRPIPWALLSLITFWREISLQRKQSVVQHQKSFATSARWRSTFLGRKLVISLQLCIQQAMNFNDPKELVECHQTLSSRVGSGDVTTFHLVCNYLTKGLTDPPTFTIHICCTTLKVMVWVLCDRHKYMLLFTE